jgi:hypothetical protein
MQRQDSSTEQTKCTRSADRVFPEIKVTWRQPGDFGRSLGWSAASATSRCSGSFVDVPSDPAIGFRNSSKPSLPGNTSDVSDLQTCDHFD